MEPHASLDISSDMVALGDDVEVSSTKRKILRPKRVFAVNSTHGGFKDRLADVNGIDPESFRREASVQQRNGDRVRLLPACAKEGLRHAEAGDSVHFASDPRLIQQASRRDGRPERTSSPGRRPPR